MKEFEVYRGLLDELPGINGYQLVTVPSEPSDHEFDARLSLRTTAGDREFLVELHRSHLSHRSADHVLAVAKRAGKPILLLAPHIGAGLAAKFSAAGVNYLDASGNCHIATPPVYIHIEGKTGEPIPRADKGLRSAGYQVLFAYLANSSLLQAPIRTVAEMADVSRQPVADMRHRLIEEGYVLSTKSAIQWHPRGRHDALSLWLHGYETVVRPSLIWGRYRTNDVNPTALEDRLVHVFADTDVPHRWGGSAAGFRMTGHYRGDRTVVHVHSTPGDFQRRLQALTDPTGNLIVMDAFGTLNWKLESETVHPLLVYSEILSEGTERAREAAQNLFDDYIAPAWERAP